MKHSEPVDNSVTVDIEARVKEYQHSLEDWEDYGQEVVERQDQPRFLRPTADGYDLYHLYDVIYDGANAKNQSSKPYCHTAMALEI